MEPTPTGGSATPSPDPAPGEPVPGDAQDDRETAARAAADDGAAPASALPSPRLPSLPRRGRSVEGRPGVRDAEPRKPPGRDPDGRPYRAPDEETLNRLLGGLRDI